MNHVVYFGDGVSRKTVLRGFKITGANNFTTGSGEKSPIESDDIRKTAFFYTDGGGIKIYARSYPTIEGVEVYDNYAEPVRRRRLGRAPRPDAGLGALPQLHLPQQPARRRPGSALDLLHGSRAMIENCLFVGNVANMGVDYVGLLTGGEYHPEHGSGAITVVRRIAGDGEPQHVHRQLERRRRQRHRQHLRRHDLLEEHARRAASRRASATSSTSTDGAGVRGSFIHGDVNDLRGTIDEG